MGWTLILKGLLLTSVKQKVSEGKNELVSNAVYLPLLYLVTATPTLLFLTGLSLFVTTAIAQFFPEYTFPTDLMLVLASLAITMSVVMFLAFRLLLKKLIPKESTPLAVNSPINIEEKMVGAFAPFLIQLKEEQKMFRSSK